MINCTKCQTANPDGAKFCKSCGTLIGKSGDKNRCLKGHILDPSWGGECPQCKAGAQATPQSGGVRLGTVFEKAQSEAPVQSKQCRKTQQIESGAGLVPRPQRPVTEPTKPKRGATTISPAYDGESRPAPGSANRLVGFLVTFSNNPSGRFFDIREGRYTIGSGNMADIVISEDTMMSSEHAIILFRRGKFLFRDNLSTNGSFINGEEVMGDVELANYDTVNMGNTEFRVIMVNPSSIT